MKRRLKDFTVKLFSLILAITMCIPTNVYALADDSEEEMPTIMRLDEDSETDQTDETSDSEDVPTISEEDRNNYDISYDAKLSDSFDSIIYTIKVEKKEESIHDPEKKMTLALATNKNQSLTDLHVDHVRDLEEGDINYSVDKEEGDLHTFAITTPTVKKGLEYTIKAPIAKDAIDTEKLYSLDMSVDIGDVNIDLRRISYKFMEEASEDNPEEVRLVLTKIKESDDAFQKIAYNKHDEEDKADTLVYTDYLISKDKQDEASINEKRNEVSYKLTLDENQDPTTAKIALDYFKANDKGFVLQKEFSTEIAYQEDLTLDVPAGYLLKLTYTNQTDKAKTKVENYSVNGRQVKNPRFVKEEEKANDEDEDPAAAEKEEKPAEKDSNKQTKENESKDTKADKKEDKKEEPSKKEEEKAKEPTNLEKADAELKKALADPKNTIKEIQDLLDTFEKKYNLSQADQQKLMTDNNDAIVALVEKDRKENFRPNVLATVPSPSFEGKEFNLKTTMKALASKANPIPGGYYFDIKVGKYLTLKQGDYIRPLMVNGKVVATGQYFENGDDHYIRYWYIDPLTSSVEIPIDQTLVFDTRNTQGMDSVDVVIQAQPKNNPAQTMKTITVKKDADSPVSTEFVIDSGKSETTTYPYQLSWRTTSTKIKNKDGKEITTPQKDAYVEWDIEIDTAPLKAANVDFKNLNLTVFAPKNEGLDKFYFQYSNSPITSLEGATQVESVNNGEIMNKNVSISKSKLGDKLYVKVKGMIDPSKVHETYTIGIRANPDSNYVEKIVKEFEEKFKSIPSIFKWAEGLDDAKKLAEVPFNLVETMIPARIGLRDNVTTERFYYDSSRTIVADRTSDTRAQWYALDLLRHGETTDQALDNPNFTLNTNTDESQNISPEKTYYVPLKNGGYRKTSQIRDVQLSNGEFIPGTLVSYEYRNQKGTRDDAYQFNADLKQKQDSNFNLDGSGPTEGGMVDLYTQRISQQELETGYLAYIEKPYTIMRINQNFDMVQCFNSGVPDPTYNGKNKKITLDKNENPTGDFLISRLNESIGRAPANGHRLVNYLSDSSRTFDGMNLRNGYSTNGEAMEELMKRIYFYGEEVKDEYEGKFQTGKTMHRHIENSMYQRVLHRFTDGTDLSVDFFPTEANRNDDSWQVPYTLTGEKTSKGAWKDNFLGKDLDRMMKDRPDSDYLRKLRDDEERITRYPIVKNVQEEMAERLYEKIKNSYQNSGEWTQEKANTVDLVFYSHNVRNGKYQELITGRVTKPIEIDKFAADGKTRLGGAKFRLTNVYTRSVIEWSSQENGPSKLYLEPGTYRVEEIEAPKGFEKIKPFNIKVERVEVNPDDGSYNFYNLPNVHVNDGFKTEVSTVGEIPQDAEGKDLVSVTNGKIKLEVKNTQDNLGKLEFVKRNNSTRLFGAGFTLKKLDANSLEDAKKQLAGNNLVYDEEGYKQVENFGTYGIFTFEQIPAGYYILEETTVPKGYQKAPLYLVEAKEEKQGNETKVVAKFVDKDLKTESVKRNGEEVELSIIKNEAKETKISFRKVRNDVIDDKGNEHLGLPDAKFRLMSLSTIDQIFYLQESYSTPTSRNNGKRVDGQNAEGGGYISFDKIKPGTYLLQELQAPKGYERTKLHGWKLVVEKDLSHKLYEVPTEDDINSDNLQEVSLDTIINAGDNIKGDDKRAYQIGNAPRKIDYTFGKYLSKDINQEPELAKELLKDSGGSPLTFNLYKADYYGAKLKNNGNYIKVNKHPIVQNIAKTGTDNPRKYTGSDFDYLFELHDLEFGGYYVLEEANPPKGYQKSNSILLQVVAEAETTDGEMNVKVRDINANTKFGPHGFFSGVINYNEKTKLGKFSIKKTGNALDPYEGKVGLRRAYFRLYETDDNFNKYKNAAGIYDRYIQKVTPGIPLTKDKRDANGNIVRDEEGRPIQEPVDPKDLPADQGILTFDQLKPGKYILEEYRGPAGYERDPRPWYIVVDEDGTVTKYRTKEDANNKVITDYSVDTVRTRLAGLDFNNQELMAISSQTSDEPSLDMSKEEAPTRQMAPQAVAAKGWQDVDPDRSDAEKVYKNETNGRVESKIIAINKDDGSKAYRQQILITPNKKIKQFLELEKFNGTATFNSIKVLSAKEVGKGSTLEQINGTPKPIPYTVGPYDKNNNNIMVARFSTNDTENPILIEVEVPYTSGEKIGLIAGYYLDGVGQKRRSSTYAKGYENEDAINRETTYKVNIDPNIKNGKVSAVKSENLKEGDTVNLTVTPDKGYKLKSLSYTANGVSTPISGNSFTMPAADVTVSAVFENETPTPDPDPDPDPDPSGNMDIEVTFTYMNEFEGKDNSDSVYAAERAGDIILQVKDGGIWTDVKKLQAPKKGLVNFEDLDASKEYRLYYKKDEDLSKEWHSQDIMYIPIKAQPNLDSQTVRVTIANGNLTEIFNRNETGFRIPLRITKVNENQGALSGAQFEARKIVNGDKKLYKAVEGGKIGEVEYVKDADENPVYHDEAFDAVSEATGEPGDNYFRELTPGIYELKEKKTPDGSYRMPLGEDGEPMKWYFRVFVYADKKPSDADYMGIDFFFTHDFDENDAYTKPSYKDEFSGKHIEGLGNDNIAFNKYAKIIEDDGRSKPARPDAPYKGIHDVQITNFKNRTELNFKKKDGNNRENLEGAIFTLKRVKTREVKQPDGKKVKEIVTEANGYPQIEGLPDKDENGKELTKAQKDALKIQPRSEDDSHAEAKSKGNLGVSFTNISEGTYILEESKPAKGYEKLDGFLTITFTEDEKGAWTQEIRAYKKEGKKYIEVTGYTHQRAIFEAMAKDDENPNSYTKLEAIFNKKQYINFKFRKVEDVYNAQTDSFDEEPLPNSTFRVTQVDEKGEKLANGYESTQRRYSGYDFNFENLGAGHYKLEETRVITGYEKQEAWYFDVVQDPNTFKLKIVFKDKDAAIRFAPDDKDETGKTPKLNDKNDPEDIRVANYQKTNFRFKKQDQNGKGIENVGFVLKKVKSLSDPAKLYEYDDKGRLIKLTDGDKVTTFEYEGESDQLVKINGQPVTDENTFDGVSGATKKYYEFQRSRYDRTPEETYTGEVDFRNLESGLYELVETHKPEGYDHENTQDRWIIKVERTENGLEVTHDTKAEEDYFKTYANTPTKDEKGNEVEPYYTTYSREGYNKTLLKPAEGDNKTNGFAYTLTNRKTTTDLKWKKITDDQTDRVIESNTIFTLLKAFDNPDDMDKVVSGLAESKEDPQRVESDDGTFEINDLKKGIYVLYEDKAPEGYKMMDRQIIIRVYEENGQVKKDFFELERVNGTNRLITDKSKFKYLKTRSNGPFNPWVPVEDADGNLFINNESSQHFLLTKGYMEDGNKFMTIDKGKLELKLYPESEFDRKRNPKVFTKTIDLDKDKDPTNPKAYRFDVPGVSLYTDYILEETIAPDGFTKTTNKYRLQFVEVNNQFIPKLLAVLDKDGKEIKNENGNYKTDTGFTFNRNEGLRIEGERSGESTLKIVNKKTDITFTKVNQSDEKLSGVSFYLKKDDPDDSTFYPVKPDMTQIKDGTDNGVYEVTSDTDGNFSFEGLIEGTYEVWERKAPEGYITPDKAVKTFRVENGQVTVINSTSVTDENRKELTKVVNLRKPEIFFEKIDGSDKTKLQNAEFRLDKKNENKTYVQVDTVTSNSDGKFSFTNLDEGEYKVVETKAPSGYTILNKDAYYFKVENGKVFGKEKENGDYQELTDNSNTKRIQIKNFKSAFPSTGGPGTWIGYTLLGTLIMSIGGAYIALKKKEQLNQANPT